MLTPSNSHQNYRIKKSFHTRQHKQLNPTPQKIALWSVFLAFALLCSYLEYLVQFPSLIPGVKLGLCNALFIIFLYYEDFSSTLLLSLARILLSSFLFGNWILLFYSLGGSFFGLTAMYLSKSYKKFSHYGVSMMGSVFFQIGQILVAMQLLHNTHLIFYLTFLLPTGMCAGLLVAYIVQPLLKKELLLCLFSSDPT